jgi:predicted nucleotide-binding protein
LTTTSPDSSARLQAFGVTFRRLDIEQMISAEPQGASGASLSSTQTRAGSKGATPTGDGDWITAAEAIELFPHGEQAICAHAKEGLVRARASLLVWGGERRSNADVPPEFWWAAGWETLTQDWRTGHFETNDRRSPFIRHKAFGVTFRQADIEQLKPATAANPNAPPSPTQRSDRRTVFIGHGHSLQWLKLKDFLRDRLRLSPVEFNSTSAAGVATTERLKELLKQADFAFLILTGEDEQATGELNPRLNVVHEAGLFQAKLGFEKALILLEEGCPKFSNVHGLNDIRFPKGKIEAAFEEIRGVLEREKLIS